MTEIDSKPQENLEGESGTSEEPDGESGDQQAVPVAGKPVPADTPQSQVRFPGELAISFREALAQVPRRNRPGFLLLVSILQPILGALPHPFKVDLEARIGKPMCFSAAGATGLNIFLNFIVYPLALMLLAVILMGVDVLFSQSLNGFILTGLFIGFAEGFFRLREGVFQVRPEEELVFRASFYGAPMVGLFQGLLARHSGLLRRMPVPVEGFYGKGFVDKLERERRYGQAYTIEDLGRAYHLRMEFPRKTPDIGLLASADLPADMPDYAYELDLKDDHFIIKGRCVDERVKKITGNVGAFPPGFTTVIPLQERVRGFSHYYENKLLEVLLLKETVASPSPA